MKIKFSINNEKYGRTHSHEIELHGYYGTEEVIKDFERTLHYHELKYKEWKDSYISKWGEDKFNKFILGVE